MTDAELLEFWDTYIGDRGYVHSDAITQIFARGPLGGLSIREGMEICIDRLGKTRPTIKVWHDEP